MAFDPSIILASKQYTGPDPNETMRTLSELALRGTQQQQAQVSLADLLQQRQDRQSQGNIYRQNANTPENLPTALMSAGFGPQAFAAQDQSSQMQKQHQDLIHSYRQWVTSTVYGSADQADYDRRRAMLSPQEQSMLPQTWAEAKPLVDAIAIPADKRADDARADSQFEETKRHNRAIEARPLAGAEGANGFGGKPLSEKDYRKAVAEFQNKMSPETTRKLLGAQEMSLIRAEELQQFVKDKTGKTLDLSPNQMREAFTMFAQAVQQGGQPAMGQIEHLTPDTLKTRFASGLQFLTGDPQGADSKAFIEQLLTSMANAKRVAEGEQLKLRKGYVPGYAYLRKHGKEFDSILKQSGIDPATVITGDDGAVSFRDAAAGADDVVMVAPPNGGAPVPVHRSKLDAALKAGGKQVPGA